MKVRVISILLAGLVFCAGAARAQDSAAVAEQQAERLRAQLREVTDKEAQLQERVRQLDEQLRPENVERSVAGVGTTDARALREQRREQLERQKALAEEQLRSLATSRTRLETTIALTEAEAVRLRASALGASNAPPQTTNAANAPAATSAPAAANAAKKPRVRRPAKKARRIRARRRVRQD